MADLKVGSTTGGSVIWHQGNFPLNPAGDDVLYKSFKIYSEYNKPQATDNDFVSKANGGTKSQGFQKEVEFKEGVKISATFSGGSDLNGLYSGNGDGASREKANMDLRSWYGIGIWNTCTSDGIQGRTIWFNARSGKVETVGNIVSGQQVISNASVPTGPAHLTRKDYVDGAINIVTANANSRVLRSGDTMTGNLTAPNLFSQNPASQPSHVPRFDQIVIKDSVQDFGYY
ncbi:putative long tail fiber protein [Escherichia phage 132]|nr:putative long tail fiber protein [Escherichia phage 132]